MTPSRRPADWLGPGFEPGEAVIWRHEERGGYGYITPVPVTVVRQGSRRVLVEAPLAAGGTRRVWVSPNSLRRQS